MLAGASYYFDKTTEFDLALSEIKRIAVEHSAGAAGQTRTDLLSPEG
ncbi:hypothetical protein [Paraburkholderia sp. BCC1885]|nr:hypothetical protein [Paraburkholderia sp. BCC1885]